MSFYSALVTAPEGTLLKLRFLVSSELAGGAIGSRQIICEACAVQVHRHVATALQLFGVALDFERPPES
jgi:hypothetical protein